MLVRFYDEAEVLIQEYAARDMYTKRDVGSSVTLDRAWRIIRIDQDNDSGVPFQRIVIRRDKDSLGA